MSEEWGGGAGSQAEYWQHPPATLSLDDHEVHIWRAVMDEPAPRAGELPFALAPEELARANRLHFRGDQDRFILTRVLQRVLLARYTGLQPGSLRFRRGPHGKPTLAIDSTQPPLNFNISHAGDIALFAVSRGREVGIDVEMVRPDFGWAEISRLFTPGENTFLHSLAEKVRAEAFFRLWTRKEAYAKAMGLGLSLPLDQLDLSGHPNEPTLLILEGGIAPGTTSWSLRELTPWDGYIATLAVKGDIRQLTCRQYILEPEAILPLRSPPHGH